MNLIRKEEGKSEDYLEKKILMSSRKKRLKEIKNKKLKLSDYQTIVSALLYGCYKRKNVLIVTCDMDLSDIRENIMRSVIEKFSINKILEKRLSLSNFEYQKTIKLNIYLDDIYNEVKKTFSLIKSCRGYTTFQVGYYKRNVKRVFGHIEKLPILISDFILENKLNCDCISIPYYLRVKNFYRYIMNADYENDKINLTITLRNNTNYGCIKSCEDKCLYAEEERTNPTGISPFIVD